LGLVLLTVLAIALYTEAKPIEDVTELVLADEVAPTTGDPIALNDAAETTYAPSYDEVTGGKGLNLDGVRIPNPIFIPQE